MSRILLILQLTGLLTFMFSLNLVVAESRTIYIRANGSIDPPTANIATVDNVTYVFTGNDNEYIRIERDNIIIDGTGYLLQGPGNGTGITLSYRNNVTVKNIGILSFDVGISLSYSRNINLREINVSSNTFYGIRLSNSMDNLLDNTQASTNLYGISLYNSSDNTLTGNMLSSNTFYGIHLTSSSRNTIMDNIAVGNDNGIWLRSSGNNTLSGNNASNNDYGIFLDTSSSNTITGNTLSHNNLDGIILLFSHNMLLFHNNFDGNPSQAYIDMGYGNIWDSGYPMGGNYWSDYEDRYPNASEISDSGIWDTPYILDENNQDNYPLIPEFSFYLIIPLFILTTLMLVIASQKKALEA